MPSVSTPLNPMPKLQDPLDQMFQALADPTRRAIVDRLSRGPASVSELAAPFEITLPAVVQHLQVLEQSGLVQSRKTGRVRTCALDGATMERVEQWIFERRQGWEKEHGRASGALEL